MIRRHSLALCLVLTSALGLAVSFAPADALELWTGRTFLFTRPDGADWTQPVNQDRITPIVWLTRKSSQGLFNIAQEAGYSASSPTDTEWASGNAINYPSLTFQPWVQWATNNPPGTIGVDAVVHLVTEDIYIDIRFESWTGSSLGGGFSYYRAIPPVVPADRGSWGRLKALYR
jgi:hypothetical protein